MYNIVVVFLIFTGIPALPTDKPVDGIQFLTTNIQSCFKNLPDFGDCLEKHAGMFGAFSLVFAALLIL